MKSSSVLGILIFIGTLGSAPVLAETGGMWNGDPQHTGSVPDGPAAPLRQAWTTNSADSEGNDARWPVLYDGTVYASSGNAVLALDARTGERRWEAVPPEGQNLVAPAVDQRGVFIPVPGDKILALDRASGKDLWRFQAASDVDTSPTIAEGRLYFGSAEAKTFYCVDAATGSPIWETVLDLEPYTSPVVAGGLVVFSVRDLVAPDAYVVALDAETGLEVWRTPQTPVTSAPTVLGDKLILGSYDFSVNAYELSTGRRLWKAPVEDAFGERSAPATAFGDVFVADRVGNFYRLDGRTGARKWIFSDTEGTFDESSPVIAGRTMFIGGGAGWIHAVDVESGEQLWRKQVGGSVLSGAADSERFYFAVKFRNEGIYAFEHDPDGKSRTEEAAFGPFRTFWIVGFVLLSGLGAMAFLVRRKRVRR